MLSAEQPDQAPADAGTYRKGETLKVSSTAGRVQKATDKGDEVVAIVASTMTNDRGEARALTAGERLPVWPIGCQKTVQVRSLTGVSWSAGDVAYQDDTDGQISKTADTSRPIGHYARYGYPDKATVERTTGRGVLVWVTLDTAVGETLV